ncbi:MAG: hypothetical protein IPG32_00375 [Saprospirales bacterium]|nr:hypothetical protein [Saprospirales bacterium]
MKTYGILYPSLLLLIPFTLFKNCKTPSIGPEKISKEVNVLLFYGEHPPIYVQSHTFQIDTTFLVVVNNPTELRIDFSGIEPPLSRANLPQKKAEALNNKGKLEEVEKLIRELEEDLKKYLKENPRSAMKNFFEVFGFRKNELDGLKKRVLVLLTRFQEILDQTSDEDILDLSELDASHISIKKNMADFLRKVNSTEFTYRTVKGAQPFYSLKTDIFFNEGKYQIQNLSAEQKKELDELTAKIHEAISEDFKDFGPEEYRFEIWTTGYTDGKPVSVELDSDIQLKCPGEYRSVDGNDCLSYLRASEISRHVVSQFQAFNPVPFPEGRGSELAGGNTEANSGLRKCTVSFSIIPHELRGSE